MKKQPPPWRDEDAVADWVYEALEVTLEEAALEEERQFMMLPWDTHPGVPASEICDRMEQDAVAATERGDFEALADLLRPEHPMNAHPMGKKPISDTLKPGTRTLMADQLTGKFKAKKGRPKMTAEERRAKFPVHDAADDVDGISAMLRRDYPTRDDAEIRKRAREVVARRYGIEVETLVNYLDRPLKDRRRPTQN